MRPSTAKHLTSLNNQFYNQEAESFDHTRSGAIPSGWQKLSRLINTEQNTLKVLDLGCGNGRLVEWLKTIKRPFSYTGVDQNEALLTLAKSRYNNAETHFIQAELMTYQPMGKFDLMAAFGVMHHLPGITNRQEWLGRLTESLNDQGILGVSFWQYQKDERFKRKQIPALVETKDLEPGDSFLGWQNSEAVRFVHVFEDQEIDTYIESIKLPLIDDYLADGKTESLNRYLIWQKQA